VIERLLNSPTTLAVWAAVVAVSLVIVVRDLRTHNAHIAGLMKWVWILTVLYSGAVGLAVYYYSGRRQIKHDSLWRRGFRSVAHCYSGCGGGEIVGVSIAAGLLGLGNPGIALTTFLLAYVAGFALTVGPLLQEGVSWSQALKDAFYSETASITVMELVAIGVDLLLAGRATMGQPLFWSSMVISLSAGLLAAYPVNVLLIHWGIKEGMHSPKQAHGH
jgi:hypothetical protein